MNRLFDNTFVYPSDEKGTYIDLDGEVIRVGEPLSNDVGITVKTHLGTYTGYTYFKHAPHVGCIATIRVYRSGGGWYPDNKIVGWRIAKDE